MASQNYYEEEGTNLFGRIFHKMQENPIWESLQQRMTHLKQKIIGSSLRTMKPRPSPRSSMALSNSSTNKMGYCIQIDPPKISSNSPSSKQFNSKNNRIFPEEIEFNKKSLFFYLYFRVCNSKSFFYRGVKIFTILLFVLLTLFILTVSICKQVMDTEKFNRIFYGTCSSSKEHLDDVRNQVKQFSVALSQHGIKYWLDYGTSLGAWRDKDIILWDHDADMSFLESDQSTVENIYTVLFGNLQNGDINRYYWKKQPNGMLRRIHGGLFSPLDSFNSSFVEDTEPCEFGGFYVQCANHLSDFVKMRFPHTWNIKLTNIPSCISNNEPPFVD
eukprot:Sdes_comp20571_c0_seq1m15448